ncbi:hypothetical protein PR048_025931 [Dryococelus australis]|uniref:Uncharacterized protein n=1 Tax=Dryococelus australis TaxID=614101 RepID=A0ABQ9GJY0_9NEOP|nr:hypothetical protein PR048_025931 [Dryococelus australis]
MQGLRKRETPEETRRTCGIVRNDSPTWGNLGVTPPLIEPGSSNKVGNDGRSAVPPNSLGVKVADAQEFRQNCSGLAHALNCSPHLRDYHNYLLGMLSLQQHAGQVAVPSAGWALRTVGNRAILSSAATTAGPCDNACQRLVAGRGRRGIHTRDPSPRERREAEREKKYDSINDVFRARKQHSRSGKGSLYRDTTNVIRPDAAGLKCQERVERVEGRRRRKMIPHLPRRIIDKQHVENAALISAVTGCIAYEHYNKVGTVDEAIGWPAGDLLRTHVFRHATAKAMIKVRGFLGATVAERPARSPPTKANRVQSLAGSPDFRKWESCLTMPLVGGGGGVSRGSPVPPAPLAPAPLHVHFIHHRRLSRPRLPRHKRMFAWSEMRSTSWLYTYAGRSKRVLMPADVILLCAKTARATYLHYVAKTDVDFDGNYRVVRNCQFGRLGWGPLWGGALGRRKSRREVSRCKMVVRDSGRQDTCGYTPRQPYKVACVTARCSSPSPPLFRQDRARPAKLRVITYPCWNGILIMEVSGKTKCVHSLQPWTFDGNTKFGCKSLGWETDGRMTDGRDGLRTWFNPRPGHSGFSQVGIVPDDAVGRQVSSGISRFPHTFIPAPLHIILAVTSRPNLSTLHTLDLTGDNKPQEILETDENCLHSGLSCHFVTLPGNYFHMNYHPTLLSRTALSNEENVKGTLAHCEEELKSSRKPRLFARRGGGGFRDGARWEFYSAVTSERQQWAGLLEGEGVFTLYAQLMDAPAASQVLVGRKPDLKHLYLLCHFRDSATRPARLRIRAAVAQWLGRSPPTTAFRVLDPGRLPPVFSHVGIVQDDAACWRVFSRYSRFPSPCIPAPRYPRVVFHAMSGDDGHLRVPAGNPVTRRVLPRTGFTPQSTTSNIINILYLVLVSDLVQHRPSFYLLCSKRYVYIQDEILTRVPTSSPSLVYEAVFSAVTGVLDSTAKARTRRRPNVPEIQPRHELEHTVVMLRDMGVPWATMGERERERKEQLAPLVRVPLEDRPNKKAREAPRRRIYRMARWRHSIVRACKALAYRACGRVKWTDYSPLTKANRVRFLARSHVAISINDGWNEVRMEQRQDETAGETGGKPTGRSRIVTHNFKMLKSGVTGPGIEPGSPWWEASSLTAQPSVLGNQLIIRHTNHKRTVYNVTNQPDAGKVIEVQHLRFIIIVLDYDVEWPTCRLRIKPKPTLPYQRNSPATNRQRLTLAPRGLGTLFVPQNRTYGKYLEFLYFIFTELSCRLSISVKIKSFCRYGRDAILPEFAIWTALNIEVSRADGVIEASMEQRRYARAGETGDPRENPPAQRRRPARFPHAKFRSVTRPGIRPGSPWWTYTRTTTRLPTANTSQRETAVRDITLVNTPSLACGVALRGYHARTAPGKL